MLCIPVREETLQKNLQKLKTASQNADVIEVWLDQIGDLEEAKSAKSLKKEQKKLKIPPEKSPQSLQENLLKLVKSSKKPLLAVCKPPREQGKWTLAEEKRVEMLEKAASAGFRYLDIGIETAENLIKKLLKNKKKAKIIISYHNFQKTPDKAELEKIYQKADNLGADIVKIATKINKIEENLTIFNLLCSRTRPTGDTGKNSRNPPLIAIGMGPKGKITRIFAPQLGSPITYVSLSAKTASAPGQLTVEEYYQIDKILF